MKLTVATVVTACLVGVGFGSALGGQRLTATLRVAKLHPFTVQGSHFKPRTKVKVTLVSGKRWTAIGTVLKSGVFTVTFRAATVTGCSGYTVTATGPGVKVLLKKRAKACSSPKPAAELIFGATVEMKGTHFKPREEVTVTLVSDQVWTRRARAGLTGAFIVDFGALTLNSCSAYTVKVVGSLGSRLTHTHALVPC